MLVRRSPSSTSERGAALIMALIIVSVMSVAALSVLESMKFAVRVASNIENREQARLYALGAEELASATLKAAWKTGDGANPALDEWVRRPLVFPIDGGVIEGRVRDGANCFNLNAVVDFEGVGGFVADTRTAAVYMRLLEGVGVPTGEAEMLAGTLVDWIDTDSTPNFGGAEDYYYAALPAPYRTSGQLLADVSELRSLSGYTPDLVDALDHFVCARPTTELAPLNVNTLEIEDALLLQVYLGDGYDPNDAFRLIGERPLGGYPSVNDFLVLAGLIDPEDERDDQDLMFALRSDVYDVSAVVTRYDAAIGVSSSLQISKTGDITTVSRRYGSPE